MAQTNARTETMNKTRMKVGVSWLFWVKPWTKYESMPTMGIRVTISIMRQVAKRMPGIISAVKIAKGL